MTPFHLIILRIPRTIPEAGIPLTCVMRKVIGSRAEECLSRLASIWNVADVEPSSLRACFLHLVVRKEY